MATANTFSSLTGLFKEAYADNLENLIPESAKLIRMIPFVRKSQQPGNLYHQPVIVANEQGITFNSDGSAFALNNPIALTTQDAQLRGMQTVMRSQLAYAAVTRSKTPNAFRDASKLVVQNNLESHTKYLESVLLYGGATGANGGVGVGDSSVNASATSTVVTMLAASWAPGIWCGAEGAAISFFKVSDNTAAATTNLFYVTSVDFVNKKLTISGTAVTGIGELDTSLAAGDCYIRWYTANGTEMTGLQKIFANTGSLFNIDAAAYAMWAGNSYSTSGTLTMSKVNAAIARAVARGLNEDVDVLVNPDTWTDLQTDLSALRRYGATENKAGSDSITYYGQNGKITIMPYNMVKAGLAFVMPTKRMIRLGSTEISFNNPATGNPYFTELASSAGYEIRSFSDQSVFCETPARAVLISGITNAS